MLLLETPIQQKMATKEICWDLWKQDQVNSLYRERQTENMILKNLKIFSQNVCKNHFIINTILETQSYYDIVLIQEPPWFVIHKVPSILNCEGEDFIGTVHHPNWLLFASIPINRLTSPELQHIFIFTSHLFIFLYDLTLSTTQTFSSCHLLMTIYTISSLTFIWIHPTWP